MDKLLTSRTRRDEQLISVGNISPQKYGRSAFCNLQYTPSKLVDNILFKQVSTLKKVQQQSSKTRQFEAINDCLMDKLKYMQEQKTVIIQSLNQQIVVYKKIIKEMETKNQDRIKQLQKKFKQELAKIIGNKEEQAKFVQSQQEILQTRIDQLEKINQAQQQKIDSHERDVADIKSNAQKWQKQVENLNYRIKEKCQQIKEIEQKNRKQIEDLHRKVLDTEMTWKEQLRDALNRKQIQIEAIQSSHRQQISKFEQLRELESTSHKKQVNQIIHSYEKQLKKLSDLIANKERALENISRDYRQQKSKNLNIAKNYESQLGEITKYKLLTGQLQTQNDKLRDLLIQSSKELERCKSQFLVIERENGSLRLKLKSSDDEAKTWRQSYYMISKRG